MTALLMMLAIVAKMTDEEEKCWRKYDDTPKEQEKSEAKDFPNLFGFCWRITGGMDLDQCANNLSQKEKSFSCVS